MTIKSQENLPVLIVGGGIGGLAAAIALAQQGYRVTVLEQARKFEEVGAGIQIGPNAYAALEALGVGKAAKERSVFCQKFVLKDGVDGSEVLSIPMEEEYLAHFGNEYGVIHRADIHLTLLEGARETGKVEIHADTRIEGIEQDDSGVTVYDARGACYRGCLLIGADGGKSVVRQQLVGDSPRPTGHIVYRAVIDAAEFPDDLKCNAPVIWMGPDCHMVNYPLQGGRNYNIVATFKARQQESPGAGDGTHEEVLEGFASMHETALRVLRIPKRWGRWVTADKEPISRWVFDRVVLLGDAAHPSAQYLAQGACMTLEDGVTLGAAMRVNNGDHVKAFAAYEQARVLRTARLVLTAREMGRLAHAKDLERLVRNSMWRGLPSSTTNLLLNWMWGWKAETCLNP